MYFKRKPISKLSSRGKTLREMDKIHFALLLRKRGPTCEICGQGGPGIGRFHILSTGAHPRLRYADDNVLLVHWMNACQSHYLWHHLGANDPRNKRTLMRIMELRGPGYEEKLLEHEKFIGKMDGIYLMALRDTMQKELDR